MFLFVLITIINAESICKYLNVSTNLKKSKDDIISKGIAANRWERKSKNPIIVANTTLRDQVFITSPLNNLTIEQFTLDFDDHNFADSHIRIDSRPSGKLTEYAIEVEYRCKEYGGTMLNYQLSIDIPHCGDAAIYWKKMCGNPLQRRDGFQLEMAYKNYKHMIVKDGLITNSSYFDADLDNYVVNIPNDVNQLTFYLSMNTSEQQVPSDEFIMDSKALAAIPMVNMSIPTIEVDETVVTAWIEGDLKEGGIINPTRQELKLNFKCRKFGTSKVEMTIQFEYFSDINLIFVKDCTSGIARVQNAIKQSYQETDHESFTIYIVFTFITLGLVINLCLGKKRGLANVPCLHTVLKILLFFTCLTKTSIGRKIYRFIGVNSEYRPADEESDETFTVIQKQFYGSI